MRATALAFALASTMVLAGCAGGATPAGSTSNTMGSTAAPAAAPGVDTGSIAGTVVDEEQRPIQGARVALVETQAQTLTDSAGAFTFNEIPPASYRLVAEALGYQSSARKIEVRIGEITNASFVLTSFVLDAEAYYTPILRTSLIDFDQQWASYAVNVLGKANHSAVCGRCIQTIYFEPNPTQIVTENHWTQTGVVGYNDAFTLWYNWTAPGNNAYNMFYCWHDKKNWTAGELDSIQKGKVNRMMFTAQSGYFAVSFQHRVDTWTTFAYRGPLPEDFTALPAGGTPQSPASCEL